MPLGLWPHAGPSMEDSSHQRHMTAGEKLGTRVGGVGGGVRLPGRHAPLTPGSLCAMSEAF